MYPADNGCDGCTPGATEACYTGPLTTANRGVCRPGRRTCGPDGRYGRAIFTDLNGNILRHVPLDQLLDF